MSFLLRIGAEVDAVRRTYEVAANKLELQQIWALRRRQRQAELRNKIQEHFDELAGPDLLTAWENDKARFRGSLSVSGAWEDGKFVTRDGNGAVVEDTH